MKTFIRQTAVVLSFCVALVSCAGSGHRGAGSVPVAGPHAASQSGFAIPPALTAPVPPKPPSLKAPPRPKNGAARRVQTSASPPPFFNGAAALGNGAYYLAFPNTNVFGYYSYLDGDYIYHFDMGYEYYTDANDGKGGIYFYDFASDHWWYTSPQYPFPYVFDFTLNATLYYYPDTARAGHYTTNPRYFYNFGTSQIIKMPDPSVPTHVQNWLYACHPGQTCVVDQNVGVSLSWMASKIDWNEVRYKSSEDDTGQLLSGSGAKHIIIYVDPNLSPYCPVPAGYGLSSNDFPEPAPNCTNGQVAQYLPTPPPGGDYRAAYQHQANGNRIFDHADGVNSGNVHEPLYIGSQLVRDAYRTATSQNAYATDVFEDDSGGAYNCIIDSNGRCDAGAAFGTAHYAPPLCDYSLGYWCYKFGETANEWDRAANPQQAYATDAIALSNNAAHPVIGNNGGGTNAYDLQWVSASNVKGAMMENVWSPSLSPNGWTILANDVLTYHNRGKYLVEQNFSASPISTDTLFFQIASHWIVYDPTYSIEALEEVNGATTFASTYPSGVNSDTTFPEETVVPLSPLVATPSNNDSTVFRTAAGLFVREYASCYQSGTAIGRCAAVLNTNGATTAIAGLTSAYGHVLTRNTSATWAAGGTAQWSTTVPTTVGPHTGVILAQ